MKLLENLEILTTSHAQLHKQLEIRLITDFINPPSVAKFILVATCSLLTATNLRTALVYHQQNHGVTSQANHESRNSQPPLEANWEVTKEYKSKLIACKKSKVHRNS